MPITSQKLDELATTLKKVFSHRQIRLPRHRELVEQLETLELVERRRDLVQFQPTHGRHDDLPFALALAVSSVSRDVGRVTLPATFNACYREQSSSGSFWADSCFLLGGPSAPYIPSGDPSCTACPGWQGLKAARQRHRETGGEPCDLRTFVAYFIQPNAFQNRMWARRWADKNL